ncbi:MAG TPA: hypothetical protein VEJ88_07215 [Dissulfurispiraceae bacterium]|nr:hypothetical protein [Dissulfurispiraceae bacterium]
MSYLQYKAGPSILGLIRDEGLSPKRVRVFAGPAGGPKWFVSVGFDRMLIKSRFLQRGSERVVLAGASAGAWRCLTMACADPLDAHERLRIAYSRNIFTAEDTPESISRALRNNVEAFVKPKDVSAILEHPAYSLAIHAVRAKGLAASENRKAEAAALIAAAAMNFFSPSGVELVFERVIFFSGPQAPDFLHGKFHGTAVKLTSENLYSAALATGSLPYIVAGVKNVPGAPPGIYRDGGVVNYQLNQDYLPGVGGITLFFHYQERIAPGWFDKRLFWRSAATPQLERVLQVFPSPDFIRLLPDGRLPDRNDFIVYADNTPERIRRWDEVSRLSDILGDQFIEDVESGRICDLVQPL